MNLKTLAIAFVLTSNVAVFGQQFQISTAAGASLATTPVPATSAALGQVQGLTVDPSGNVYFTNFLSLVGRNEQAVIRLNPNGTIVRFAGLPEQGFLGDGGPALSAEFSTSGSIVADRAGNIYMADTYNNRIRKITAAGVITTIAGTGAGSDSGDGGPALSAAMNSPSVVAMDAAGDLFVADLSRVREIATDGVIHTVAGNGSYGLSGDGGPAVSAQLGYLGGIAIDNAGNLYLADNYQYSDDFSNQSYARIRKVTPDGTINTIAGGPAGSSGDGGPAASAQFNQVGALAIDPSGNLFIVDISFIANGSSPVDSGAIREINTAGTISTLVVSFSALPFPSITFDSAGNLYISGSDAVIDSSRILKVSPNGTITTLAGNGVPCCGGPAWIGDGGPAAQAIFNTPTAVAADHSGNLYIADTVAGLVRKIGSNGIVSTIAGVGGAGPVTDNIAATSAFLFYPSGLALDDSGNLYLADCGDGRIRRIDPSGVITTVAGAGTAGRPGYSGDGGPAAQALLSWPKDVALDHSGNMYIADTGNSRIRKVDANGVITTIAGTGIAGFSGDQGPAIAAQLNLPTGVAVDNSGNVYVTDTGNFRIRKIAPDGTVTTLAGTGTQGFSGDGGLAILAQLGGPLGIKLDSSGNLYVADGTAVRLISPAGMISTVAGTGMPGYTGDGGPATAAELTAWGLGFDSAGDLYVTDPLNNVIRLLKPSGQ